MTEPAHAALREQLESVWAEEVLPVFEAEAAGDTARAYLGEVRDRLLNPFLQHTLADIAQGHTQKKERRLAPVVARAASLGMSLPQPRLRHALALEALEPV